MYTEIGKECRSFMSSLLLPDSYRKSSYAPEVRIRRQEKIMCLDVFALARFIFMYIQLFVTVTVLMKYRFKNFIQITAEVREVDK
jgi:hypothetical protein